MTSKLIWEAAKKSTVSMLDKNHPSEVETVEAWQGGDNLEKPQKWQPTDINELFSSKAWVKLSGLDNINEMEVHDEHIPPQAVDQPEFTLEEYLGNVQEILNQIEIFGSNTEVFLDDAYDLDLFQVDISDKGEQIFEKGDQLLHSLNLIKNQIESFARDLQDWNDGEE